MKLKNQTSIVTGGGQGIGRAICIAFAREGASVAVADINETSAGQVAAEITDAGGKAVACRCDVGNAKDIETLVTTVLRAFGQIDILVNNAGLAVFRSVEACTEEEWDRVFAVNLKGPFLLSKAVMPTLKERRSGAIVNLASIAGKTGGVVAGAPYSVSKAGIDCLTKSLARELAPYRVRVNAIAPGIIDTVLSAGHPQSFVDAIPLGEKGRPEDVAACALFLVSSDSRHITGETIDVNGGLLMD